MNRKKVKRQKKYHTSNDKDPNQEVLVLPPNLLEKLGINLGKICVNQDSAMDSSGDIQNRETLSQDEIFKQQNKSHMANDSKHASNEKSSIIETANLMKESVFLSPTFNTPHTVVLSNNLEMYDTKKPDALFTEGSDQNVEADKNVNMNIINSAKDFHDIVTGTDDQSISNIKLSTDLNFDQSHNEHIENCLPKKNICESNNKINILSEEIIDPVKFNSLITFDSHNRKAMVSVPIDTLISINKTTITEKETMNNNNICLSGDVPKEAKSINENINRDIVQELKQNEHNKVILINSILASESNHCKDLSLNTPSWHEKSPEIILERGENKLSDEVSIDNNLQFSNQDECKNDKSSMPMKTNNISEIKTTNSSDNESKNCDYPGTEILQEIHQNVCQENNVGFCSESLNNKGNTSIKDIQLDSVKTIANILCQHLNKDKHDDFKNLEKFHAQEIFFALKQNKVKSKLSVQGVEKPGGESKLGQIKKPNIRTYVRNKKSDLHENTKFVNDYNVQSNVTKDIDYKIEVDHSHIQYPQQFCICSDFGRLDHYTFDESYNHPHFMKTDNNSSPEIVFSIYEDNRTHTHYVENNSFDDRDFEETPDSEYNICCNVVQIDIDASIEENIDFKNIVFYENKSTDVRLQENTTMSNVNTEPNSICNNIKKFVENESKLTNDHRNKIKESTEEQIVYVIQPDEFEVSDIDDSQRKNDADTNIKKKRKISTEKSAAITDVPRCKKPTETVTCRICNETFAEIQLENHIAQEHKDNDQNIDKSVIDSCVNEPVTWEVPLLEYQPKVEVRVSDVTCAVCRTDMADDQWLEHLAREHSYLAWKEGQAPLDLTDESAVHQHLVKICDKIGKITCNKCFVGENNVDSYLTHIKKCGSTDTSDNIATAAGIDNNKPESDDTSSIKCAVCDQELPDKQWMDHIAMEHNYLAWKVGQTKLDLEDDECIYNHLHSIMKCLGGLKCSKCGCRRKYVKSYLQHVQKCDGSSNVTLEHSVNGTLNESAISAANSTVDGEALGEDSLVVGAGENDGAGGSGQEGAGVTCGVCGARVRRRDWSEHAHLQHAYLAWKDGEEPLDISNDHEVYSHLRKILKKDGELICRTCNERRRYIKSYLHHVEKCDKSISNEQKDNDVVKCGVCEIVVIGSQWIPHIAKEHNYLSWQQGQPAIDLTDENAVQEHLRNILNKIGELTCNNCQIQKKSVKSYLRHVDDCGSRNSSKEILIKEDKDKDKPKNKTSPVKCGVCEQELPRNQWMEHIVMEHNYLAWKVGEPKLDLTDDESVHDYLYRISKENGGLTCSKCGRRRKYVKSYLHHVQTCDGTNATLESSVNDTLNESTVSALNSTQEGGAVDEEEGADGGGQEGAGVTCGVCGARVRRRDWSEHARLRHAYLAWEAGQVPLNVKDEEAVYEHLYKMNTINNGLKCYKCDKTRKYVKAYLNHMESCTTVTAKSLGDLNVYECAICSEKVEPSKWKKHAMKKHYNIAWIVGESPIDVNNPFVVEKYLKEYKQQYNKLQCMACGLVRVSFSGFYAHIIQCGKTDEETEMYKSVCDICNNKYLCIYKHQHMSMHREQVNAKNRKLFQAEKKKEPKEAEAGLGRRKAAEKAKDVIEKYKNEGVHKCPSCGFGADDESELQEHVCSDRAGSSDDDASADLRSAASSDDDSFDSDLESDHSRNEQVVDKKKKKKHGDTLAAKVTRIPFKVNKPKAYIAESAEDFCDKYFTSDVLFPQWRTCVYEGVAEEELPRYMPLVQQSCKLMFDGKDWTTYQQFEARGAREASIFVGGGVHGVSWAPPRMEGEGGCCGNFLAVATHRDADAPRFDVSHTYRHPAMLQIWDFGNFDTFLPKFVLGIAHDYGTVWAMDWCPSGVRDPLDTDADGKRLGLLVAACSSGSAYIFSVPYPSTITKGDKLVYKLKPVAELRFSRGEREIYQASSVVWSLEKGHSDIVVGYADGMLGFYNIDLESPLLTDVEDGVTIFYPYEEEQRHNSSITDLSTLPSGGVSAGCVSSASQTGAALRLRGACVRSLLPATSVAFLPHWPAAVTAGNDTIVTHAVNELDCWGVGRRLGSVQCWGGCWRCGAAAAAAPPALRLLHAHPAHADIIKKDIAVIHMRPLESKPKKVKNDDLAVKIEPTKYDDAIKIYGLEFKFLIGNSRDYLQQVMAHKEQCPERFPLADVTSLAFCPSAAHHRKLAVATYSGFVFLITV